MGGTKCSVGTPPIPYMCFPLSSAVACQHRRQDVDLPITRPPEPFPWSHRAPHRIMASKVQSNIYIYIYSSVQLRTYNSAVGARIDTSPAIYQIFLTPSCRNMVLKIQSTILCKSVQSSTLKNTDRAHRLVHNFTHMTNWLIAGNWTAHSRGM